MQLIRLALFAAAMATIPAAWGADPNAYPAAIDQLVRSGQIHEAFKEAGHWVEQSPDDPEALTLCGDLAIRCGDFDAAADCYETAIFFDENTETACKLGDALAELGRESAALACYRRALDFDSRSVAAHIGIGRLYMLDPTKYFEARLSLASALAISPEDTDARTAQTQLDTLLGNIYGAEKSLLELIDENPKNAKARLLLGRILSQRGDLQDARKYWAEYIRLEPARPEAWLLEHNLYPVGEHELLLRGTFFVFSPDGESVAHIGAGATANTQLLIASLDAPQKPTVVHQFEATPSGIDWSPDGTRIACRTYERIEEGERKGAEYTIWTVAATGGDVRKVHQSKYAGMPTWMPDSKHLCFDAYAARRGRAVQVFEDKPDAPAQRNLLQPQPGQSLQWVKWDLSGSELVTTALDYRDTRDWYLHIYRGTSLRTVSEIWHAPEPLYYPTFSPDGEAIVFLQRNSARTYNVFAAPAAGDRPRPCLVSNGQYYSSPPSISPDGKHLLVYQRSGAALIRLAGMGK